jgi:tyrosyl-tRNA synthetase
VGGGTTKVGDPSFRDESRPLLDDAGIERNKVGIRESLTRFLDFDASDGNAAILEDNDSWLSELKYIPFLRDFGTHFTVNRMLSFDSVKLRLEREQPLTLLEFNYMVMQAYDFLELGRRFDCCLQMGGSDQWGNIVNGVELGRRIDRKPFFGLTTPLITTASGQKMGKTAAGAVWLNEEMLSNFDYWQFWRNTEDADVGRFLRLFTDVPLAEIERLERLEGSEINDAKIALANAATALCRGKSAASEASAAAAAVFRSGGEVEGLPHIEIEPCEVENGAEILDLLVKAGFAGSKGEARRLIRGGGAKLDDAKIEDESLRLGLEAFAQGPVKLSAGKKRHVLLCLA